MPEIGVGWKEYTDQAVKHLEKLIEVRHQAYEQALRLKADELERRLHTLNNAHEEARRVLNTYLPREVWDKWLEADQTWKTGFAKVVDSRAGRDVGTSSAVSMVHLIVVGLISIAGLVVSVMTMIRHP